MARVFGGMLAGVLVWIGYFVQASTVDGRSWETTVIPALAAIAVGALVVGQVWPSTRRTTIGVALGTVSTVPLVLGAFAVVFTVLNLS